MRARTFGDVLRFSLYETLWRHKFDLEVRRDDNEHGSVCQLVFKSKNEYGDDYRFTAFKIATPHANWRCRDYERTSLFNRRKMSLTETYKELLRECGLDPRQVPFAPHNFDARKEA